MAVLKFRVEVEELDNVYRDVQILDSQNFKDLHDGLVKYFDIKKKKSGSFFISNDRWQKIGEITVGTEPVMDTAIDGMNTPIQEVLKKGTKKLVYVNEATPQLSFQVELKDVMEEDTPGKKYPICTKSVGTTTNIDIDNELFEDNLRIDDVVDESEDFDMY